MFCTNCGSHIQDTDLFCASCGSKVLTIEDGGNVDTSEISSFNNSSNDSSNNSTNNSTNSNYSNTNTSNGAKSVPISFDSALVNETLYYIKSIFTNPLGLMDRLSSMSTVVLCILGVLSLIITFLTYNILFDNSYFSYFVDNGQIILSLLIYNLGTSTALFLTSKTIANKNTSWLNMFKLTIVITLFSSIATFISLLFISSNIGLVIGLLCLSGFIAILLTYEGFLRITSATAKNAAISLITSYSVIAVISYLLIYN